MSRGHFSHVGNLKLLFSYCWGWKVTILILLGVGWKHTFLIWFGVRLALLQVKGGEISFPILLGAGGKVTFSYCCRSFLSYCWKSSQGGKSLFACCWELVGICFPHIVGNWWKVAFRMLGIGGHSFFSLGVGREFLPSVVALKKKTPPDSKIMRK